MNSQTRDGFKFRDFKLRGESFITVMKVKLNVCDTSLLSTPVQVLKYFSKYIGNCKNSFPFLNKVRSCHDHV